MKASIMRIAPILLALSLLFVACVSETVPSTVKSAKPTDHNLGSTVTEAPHKEEPHLEASYISEDDNRTTVTTVTTVTTSRACVREEIRLGTLDTTNTEVVDVEGKLLTAVMQQITESREYNEQQLAKLVHPDAVIGPMGFYSMTRHYQSVTKLELENSRATAVKEEFGLLNENLQIVKVHMTQLDGTPADLNLIYVYSEDRSEWLLFRID